MFVIKFLYTSLSLYTIVYCSLVSVEFLFYTFFLPFSFVSHNYFFTNVSLTQSSESSRNSLSTKVNNDFATVSSVYISLYLPHAHEHITFDLFPFVSFRS